MIDWLHRVEPDRPFLVTGERVFTYGEVAGELGRRVRRQPTTLEPLLESEGVIDCLAALAGGGAVVTGPGTPRPERANLPEGTALVVYTSGTSGSPRGVRLTRANLEAAARASVEHLGHGPEDRWLLAMPLHHVGGLSILVRSAYAGGSVHLLGGFEADSVVRAMRSGVTMVSVVPTMLRRILDQDAGPYRGLRAVLVGGGPIPEGLLERAVAAGLPVLPTYGMTETFGQVATLKPGSVVDHRAHPLPGVDVEIGADGRIRLRGPQVSPGYFGEPDRGSEWLVTSDLGEIDEEGALKVLGRADTMIVSGGENIDPARVESAIMAHPAVDEAVVVGVPDPEWGQVTACAYRGEADSDDLAAWVQDRLPRFMTPRRWRRVDHIPTTPLGKPDRLAVTALCSEEV